uniref:Uncharacterized protein n=1 Tax=Octopus bimaculoides TaxID=37653 RepID=A0A0L8HI94_OCTBM
MSSGGHVLSAYLRETDSQTGERADTLFQSKMLLYNELRHTILFNDYNFFAFTYFIPKYQCGHTITLLAND